jgi:bacterioferritin (cytochrome b1)
MGKERLIEILNDLVAVEIAAVTEYQQHAYLSENPRIVDLMEDFSMGQRPTAKPVGLKWWY